MTCRALSAYLQEKVLDKTTGKFFEEASLNAVYRTLTSTAILIPEIHLLLSELPNLLPLKYPVVKKILQVCPEFISQLKDTFEKTFWYRYPEYYQLEYIENLLRSFDNRLE